jgi:hypothetical protein
MSNYLKQFRVQHKPFIPPQHVINTNKTMQEIAQKQPKTIKEKLKIIEGTGTKSQPVRSLKEIIETKPTKNKVRKFFKEYVQVLEEKEEFNI